MSEEEEDYSVLCIQDVLLFVLCRPGVWALAGMGMWRFGARRS